MNIACFIFSGLLAVSYGEFFSNIPTVETDTAYAPRVVNGEDVKLGERPFQVSVQGNLNLFCGGSIINEYWVVTAAHCVDDEAVKSIDITAGTIDLQEPYRTHQAHRIIIHENYSFDDSVRNDIALIKVVYPFKFSNRVQPIALPESHVNVKTHSAAVVSGWGRLLDWSKTDKLQQATIYVADPKYCRNVMKRKSIDIYPEHLCANDPSIRRGQCTGDSGGPLTVDCKLAGIVSWSIKDPDCASTKFPGVYTRVSEFVEWIKANID